MTCERQFHEGDKFIRFSNNAGYSLLEERARECGVDLQYVQMVLAFCHWTYSASGGKLMIVDVEGVATRDEDEGSNSAILLYNPAIHCLNLTRYGHLNHGIEGMKRFFERHECNYVCAALRLTKFATGAASGAPPALFCPLFR